MLKVRVARTLSVETNAALGHLSAASGLVQLGQRLFVVADDEHTLAAFDLGGEHSGRLHRLFDGELPDEPKARKAAKPDLEALAHLPPSPHCPHGALLALGSGSRPQRQRAALLAFNEAGDIDGAVRVIDLSPLYEPLQARHAQLNIEGAFVAAGRFCLLQRGNQASPVNGLIGYDWLAIQAWLDGAGRAPEPVASTPIDLGAIEGVPLCFTDGAALLDGSWVFCAAAEATDDNYADGPCRGSAVGVVAADGRLLGVWPLSLRCKAEGIAVTEANGVLQLLLVTDPDDRDEPALLLSASLADPRG
ncbi:MULTISPECIES: hypothetical protein [unclassified Roseateles]|uniref:DUF6929 family protein n=1 Tax=unclassified Roseateles TaxID=2626991 RepID=UPI000714B821|nr:MULTISPECIES: hypothetical protein [unclassified Roseateles]KQW41280.1 hypothetical protein ASC81_23685 [Pelomonas sp. Root405]KRA68051.1 hypothetical protein ASD88_21665 [Pelomonas sp. Root662]